MTGIGDLKALQKAMRRISRALDVHSRRIDKEIGLTLPQLVVLTCVRDLGEVISRAISKEADLSPPTVVGILDKLEAKGMIERYRSPQDRRIVFTRLTENGRLALEQAPPPIGKAFQRGFLALEPACREDIVGAFETVAGLIETDTSDDMAQL